MSPEHKKTFQHRYRREMLKHTHTHVRKRPTRSRGSPSLTHSSPGAQGAGPRPVVDHPLDGVPGCHSLFLGALRLPRASTSWWDPWESAGIESSQFLPEDRGQRGSRHALHSGPQNEDQPSNPADKHQVRKSRIPTFAAPPPGGFSNFGERAAFPELERIGAPLPGAVGGWGEHGGTLHQ